MIVVGISYSKDYKLQKFTDWNGDIYIRYKSKKGWTKWLKI